MSIGKKIANYIKYQREKRGLSLNQFARLIEVDVSFLLRLEKGVYDDLKLSTIIKIAKVLNMNVVDFLIKCQIIDEKKISVPSLEFYLKEKFQLPPEAIDDVSTFIQFLQKKHREEIKKLKKMHDQYWRANVSD